MLTNEMVVLDVRLARSGADDELVALGAHIPKLLDAADRHEVCRLREPEVHQRDEALPSREYPRVVAELPQQRQGFGAVLRAVVLEARRLHGVCDCKHTWGVLSSIPNR